MAINSLGGLLLVVLPSEIEAISNYYSCIRGAFVGCYAYFGTSFCVTCRYFLMRATFSLVLRKHASCISISFNLGIPVAAKHETRRGAVSF